MTLEWKTESAGTGATYELQCRVTKRIGLDDGKDHQQLIGAGTWDSSTLYRVGQWAVGTKTAGKLCIMTLKRKLPADDQMEINFEEGIVPKLQITFDGKTDETRTYTGVSIVKILPGQRVLITTNAEDPSASPAPPAPPRPAKNDEEIKKLRKQVEEALAKLAEAEKTRDLALGEVKGLREGKAALEKAAGTRLEELLTALRGSKESLEGELKKLAEDAEKAQEELRRLEQEKKKIEDKNHEAEELKSSLEAELESLRGAEEGLSLDCEAARRELEELRERLGDDEDTMTLMQEEPFLKENSVTGTLEQVHKELEAAEKRIGLIIRVREKINGMIQNTILGGDGTVPLAEELGGKRNGDGSGSEEEDT